VSALFDAITRARAAGDLSPVVEAIPYARFLGLSVEVRDGELVTRLAFAAHVVGNPALPALHGGTIGALLESAAVFELLWHMDLRILPRIVTHTIDYLRTGKPLDTFASASITRRGRRVASVRVEAWQEDPARPIASANTHFLVT
jgi:acyl-coenzyme A thioesterase PaaI-like protein